MNLKIVSHIAMAKTSIIVILQEPKSDSLLNQNAFIRTLRFINQLSSQLSKIEVAQAFLNE
jgi:hypothetical protein